MKKITYILMSLCCLTLYSCGMTEPWKDWEMKETWARIVCALRK